MSNPIQGNYIDWDRDPYIYVFLVLGFLTARFFLNKFVFLPFGKYMIKIGEKESVEEKKELDKFAKYSWHGSVYVVLWVWGIFILSQQDWSFDFSKIWNFPHAGEEKLPFKWYFYVQIAWYSHGFIESLLVDGSRNDFLLMLLHHVLSVCMLLGAYWGNYHRIAASVCAEQDISDIFVYLSKNIQKSKRIPFFQKSGFLLFLLTNLMIMWFSTRVALLGMMVYTGWLYIPAEHFTLLPRILLTQLTVLLIMQIVWWIGLVKMWYDQFTTGRFHDMWHDGRRKLSQKALNFVPKNGNGTLVTNGHGTKEETNSNGIKEETNGNGIKEEPNSNGTKEEAFSDNKKTQ